MEDNRKKALTNVKKMLGSLTVEQSETIAKYGLNVSVYNRAVIEAVVANPEWLKCNAVSIAKALRACCRDGLLPDGKEAAIYPVRRKGGGYDAKYIPMREGLCKQIYRATNGVIRSGVIREGEEYNVTEASDGTGTITVAKKFRTEGPKKPIIAAWASITMPDGASYPQLFDRERLDNAKEMSRATSTWQVHEEAMCEKAVVKSLMNKMRYMLPDQLKESLDQDQEYPDFNEKDAVVIDAEPEEEAEVKVELVEAIPEPDAEPEPEKEQKKAEPEPELDLDF